MIYLVCKAVVQIEGRFVYENIETRFNILTVIIDCQECACMLYVYTLLYTIYAGEGRLWRGGIHVGFVVQWYDVR